MQGRVDKCNLLRSTSGPSMESTVQGQALLHSQHVHCIALVLDFRAEEAAVVRYSQVQYSTCTPYCTVETTL